MDNKLDHEWIAKILAYIVVVLVTAWLMTWIYSWVVPDMFPHLVAHGDIPATMTGSQAIGLQAFYSLLTAFHDLRDSKD